MAPPSSRTACCRTCLVDRSELRLGARHCERSEAILRQEGGLDCFVASVLAMTMLASLMKASIHHRWPCQLEMPEHVDQCTEALLAIGIDIHAGVVEEAGAGAQANAALLHAARDHLGRTITVAAQRAFEIAARIVEN